MVMFGEYIAEIKHWNRTRKIVFYSGLGFALMLGFGQKYIIPFALKLGATNFQIAILNSLIFLLGGLAGVFGVEMLKKTNRRSLLLNAFFIQLGLWLVLAYLASIKSSLSFVLLFIILNYSIQALYLPVWISLIGDLITGSDENKYFGIRTSVVQLIATLGSFVAAKIIEKSRFGFVIIFLIAGFGKFLSLIYQYMLPDPKYEDSKNYTLKDFVKHIAENNVGRFAEFLFFFYFATYIASPFLSPFILRTLHLNYVQYAILISITPTIVIFFSPLFGKLSDLYGEKTVFTYAAFVIPFVPLFWSFSRGFWSMFLAEIFAGLSWAAFNLSTSDYLFTSLDSQHRARGSAYIILVRNIGIAIGSLLAGVFIQNNLNIRAIFQVSSVLRFVAAFVFVRKIKELRTDVRKVVLFDYIKNKIGRINLNYVKSRIHFYYEHFHRL